MPVHPDAVVDRQHDRSRPDTVGGEILSAHVRGTVSLLVRWRRVRVGCECLDDRENTRAITKIDEITCQPHAKQADHLHLRRSPAVARLIAVGREPRMSDDGLAQLEHSAPVNGRAR